MAQDINNNGGITPSHKHTIMREKLINALIDLASDELDTETLIQMAKESDEQLLDRLIHIAHYYFMEY